MLDINLHPNKRVLRQFAAAWLVVLSGLAANQWLMRGNARIAAALLAIAVLVGAAGLVRPRAVRWLFVSSTIAAFPIGWVVSQVMLFVLFIGVMTPVALMFRLRGRDRLSRKPTPGKTSYWKPKITTEDMGRYLRQY
jgi:Saxitoxin biosynthesis operon protein SxtJ